MYSEISRSNLTRSPSVKVPNGSLSVDEARERLNVHFKDVVSVHKAFQMLGKRTEISPKVSHRRTGGSCLSPERKNR